MSWSIPKYEVGCLFFLALSFFFSPLAKSNTPIYYEYEITVMDESGLPLIGVHVYTEDHQKVNVVTDLDGKAILKDLQYADIVHFSYLGYQKLSLPFYKIRSLGGIIILKPEVNQLSEIVVIGRRDDRPEEVPFQVKNIDQKEIAFVNPQTSADALSSLGGVFVQKSQMGGGSPVIRGFEANRVLLVVDGVRMNNAIYRNGHLQNAITVDNSILERMEVIFGPGSLMYGSDALGGVVHFRSKDPKLYFGDKPGGYLMEGGAYTRFSSANEEKTIHADLNYGQKNWGSLTSFTFTDFGDLRAGSKRPKGYETFGQRRYFIKRKGVDQRLENVIVHRDSSTTPNYDLQVGTAYSQMDFLQKIRFQPNEKVYFIGNFQYSTTSNVPRYDALTDTLGSAKELKWAEWYYG
ncbi:MAG: TonB-dependent receptor, partial [Bacteroidetes bacterium]